MTRRWRLALIVAALFIPGVTSGLLTSWVVRNSESHVIDRLQAASAGACYRLNYVRWELDRSWYAAWRQKPSSGAVFLPLTDCEQAVNHPQRYRPPPARRFAQASGRELRALLARAPQPTK